MKDLVDTTEMYLRTIFELEEEGIVPLRARIVERLEQSGPTVSQTVARMERDGLVKVLTDRSLQLTESGRDRATAVMRKHRLAERLLTDVLGLEISAVHDEACRWEHVMSEEVERKVYSVLDQAQHSPFGNPIPGLDELGVSPVSSDPSSTRDLLRPVDMDTGARTKVALRQINEVIQNDPEVFDELQRTGVTIGAEVEVTNNGNTVTFFNDGKTVELSEEYGHAIRVEPLS